MKQRIAIIGGGAAGFFAAIRCAELNPDAEVLIFERGKSVLEKVRISGGGRCNVTHHCFDPRALTQYYPRGNRELLGPFMQFGPEQSVEWFEQRGVSLKTEADGRMFPQSNESQSIVDCLTRSASRAGVRVFTSTRVEDLAPLPDGNWRLRLAGQEQPQVFDKLMIATGSNPAIWEMLQKLGHSIVTPVPSLFTFNCKDPRFRELSGVSVPNAALRIPGTRLEANGPVLITHWGLSGPAVLRLSAWGARELQALDYKFELEINWTAAPDLADIARSLNQIKQESAKKTLENHAYPGISARLWQNLVLASAIPEKTRWADVSKNQLNALARQIAQGTFKINGKSTFKEEFVTAGGVDLKEIQFKNFSSKLFPNLFMAGEVLNIDAVTGGFNFQAAWTGGWLAGTALGLG